jgi:hypothetical protein
MAHIFERPAQHAVRNAITQRSERAAYIREGLKLAGYSPEVADLADLMRGDRDTLNLDMTDPGERQAAEWFVEFLAENQHNIRFVQRFGKWRS